VLEVYRRAIGEYGVPKEMLTDRGRQYTNWRGTTRFERELGKDRVRHIKSQAHHPMTLGKIERFWKTIYEEFLVRAQFGSFEEAKERIRQWVQYYNHKRPHQGIGGLCPADRYFEIQAELRKTMEQGIAENVLEMALRGKPREPFYMVGRMEGQSVVLRAEKGKLRLLVDDEEGGGKQEMVYEVTAGEEKRDGSIEPIEGEETDGQDREAEGREAGDGREEREVGPYSGAKVPGGVIGMDGETQNRRGLPGVGSSVEFIEPVAGPGDGGDAPGAAASDPGGERGSVEPTSCGIVGAEEQGRGDQGVGAAFGQTSREPGGQARGDTGSCSREEGLTVFREIPYGGKAAREGFNREEQKTCTGAGAGDSPGAQRGLDGKGGSEAAGSVAQDLLRVGGEVPESHGPGIGESSSGKAACACRPGEGDASGADPRIGEEAGSG